MRNVAPTKSNLLKLKEELSFARLGQELLDQKRSILVAELMTLVDQAAALEDKMALELGQAYRALEDAAMAMGKLKLASVARAIDVRSAIALRQRRVMGVALPVVNTTITDRPPYYSPLDTNLNIDLAAKEFRDAIAIMGKLAELKVSIMRLAAEVKRTIRKVNALEKIAVPDLEESVHFIRERLEENERETFTLMKMVKNRLAAAKQEGSLE
ncbi:MAG: ATPase [Spirochaetes bacterium GWD1_61_31]|nr:MAG: ATPase [Spirochaetes bacterium GWB1_60_80]OHD32743.1 MAG: ATPase [Spirochaetes bacterium GWC1_61_12]OHD40609.1 MAG: ATPase [Spirochaetes bacterium GWD1_61_31]OHD43881.1 MAG: ATPase [Spirochaetes bacterium GWE1_60_18]OHD59752.1 MAG: ATPase [Spirochaetes bacterium GWF1_60_12]HAP43527.1 V-type ATP synthase subunit D [Spirochaetaceae bacterium]